MAVFDPPCLTFPNGCQVCEVEIDCDTGKPAVLSAAVDALSPLGIKHIEMPLTPEKIWRAMHDVPARV